MKKWTTFKLLCMSLELISCFASPRWTLALVKEWPIQCWKLSSSGESKTVQKHSVSIPYLGNIGRKMVPVCCLNANLTQTRCIWLAVIICTKLLLEEIFVWAMGPSRGPEIGLSKRFKSYWPSLALSDYKAGIDNPQVAAAVHDFQAEVSSLSNANCSTPWRLQRTTWTNHCVSGCGTSPWCLYYQTWCTVSSSLHDEANICIQYIISTFWLQACQPCTAWQNSPYLVFKSISNRGSRLSCQPLLQQLIWSSWKYCLHSTHMQQKLH